MNSSLVSQKYSGSDNSNSVDMSKIVKKSTTKENGKHLNTNQNDSTTTNLENEGKAELLQNSVKKNKSIKSVNNTGEAVVTMLVNGIENELQGSLVNKPEVTRKKKGMEKPDSVVSKVDKPSKESGDLPSTKHEKQYDKGAKTLMLLKNELKKLQLKSRENKSNMKSGDLPSTKQEKTTKNTPKALLRLEIKVMELKRKVKADIFSKKPGFVLSSKQKKDNEIALKYLMCLKKKLKKVKSKLKADISSKESGDLPSTKRDETSEDASEALIRVKKKRKREKSKSKADESSKESGDLPSTKRDETSEDASEALIRVKKKRKKEKSKSKADESSKKSGDLPSTEKNKTTECESEVLPRTKEKRRRAKSNSLLYQDIENSIQTDLEDSTLNQEQTQKEEVDTSSNKEYPKNLEVDRQDSEKPFSVIGEVKQKGKEKCQRKLPDWLAQPSMVSIDLNDQTEPIADIPYLDDIFKKNLIAQGFKFLFPVQRAMVPWLIECDKRRSLVRLPDVCVSAPTGCGKTLAYVLPIVHNLRNRMVCRTRALVVLPVTDLATQVFNVFESVCKGTDLKTVLLTRNKSFEEQKALLFKTGQRVQLCLADIVVCTSGALVDQVIKSPEFEMQYLRYLVIDEADRMYKTIQEGFLKEVERAVFGNNSAISCCPQFTYRRNNYPPSTACAHRQVSEPLQKLLCSATLSQDPETLHTLSLYRPKLFSAAGTVGTCVALPDCLEELCVLCDSSAKPMVITYLVQQRGYKRVLCFAEEVERAHRLYLVLNVMGSLKVHEVTSGTSPKQREKTTSDFIAGRFDVLVCSDMFARGMDIEGVDCVISYDDPHLAKTYIHRSGRTARAGQPGTSITLLTNEECTRFKRKLKVIGKKLPECITVSSDELRPYVKSFQSALSITNATIDREKEKKIKRASYLK